MIDRETAERAYGLLVAGFSCSLVAERLGLFPHQGGDIVYKLRRGQIRRYADLYQQYNRDIPAHPRFYRSPKLPVTPGELYELALRQPRLFMPMKLPDVERYRALNRIRHGQEALASETARLTAEFWRRLFRHPP
jgi:hypothetical protein